MRFASIYGRFSLVTTDGRILDVEAITHGAFSADIQDAYERWEDMPALLAAVDSSPADGGGPALAQLSPEAFDNPVPRPKQVFAIGLNYADHATETSFEVPTEPPVFTKFVSSLARPYGTVALPPGRVDWEVELVVVMGRGGYRIDAADAWACVAGLSVGQDLSERDRQQIGPAPQFSLAKSFPGFSPVGPVLVTPDEFDDLEDIELGCTLNGEPVQQGRTSQMVFPVPELIARLSSVLPLLPGDVVFTGTPAGVGVGRSPQRFLAPGDELVSYVRGIGEMRHLMAAGS